MDKIKNFSANFLFLGAMFIAEVGVSGAEIDQLIQPYPRSELVYEHTSEKSESYRLVLGMLKKINNNLEPEHEKYLLAKRSVRTFYVPDEQRAHVVMQHFRAQMLQIGDLIFECDGRECGSSNFWANKVLKRSVLYGPEKFQHYIVARIDFEKPAYILVYTARRGNRKVYAHLEFLWDSFEENASKEDGSEQIAVKLGSLGKYSVLNLAPNEVFENQLVSALMELRGLFAIVGHGAGRDLSVEAEIERTRMLAISYMKRLIAKGLDAEIIAAYGVGPLSPLSPLSLDTQGADYLEVVWLKKP